MRQGPRRPRYTDYPRTVLWLVPGGSVTIGGDEPNERPSFTIEVAPFYLSQCPITNEQFEAFDPGFARSPVSPGDGDTAVGISYAAAAAYCGWYAEVSKKPMRLPTEIEWEHACRGGTEGRVFWRQDEDAEAYVWDSVNADSGLGRAEAKKANPAGLHGMLGGVWEWTSSVYRPYPLAHSDNDSVEPEASSERLRVLRGGSFRSHRRELSCSMRRPEKPYLVADDVGFRVAKSLRR